MLLLFAADSEGNSQKPKPPWFQTGLLVNKKQHKAGY
jgi:hypothetical protein